MAKSIKVFFSPLSRRFYASRAYKEIKTGIIQITGEKFDVTDDIAALVERHNVVFSKLEKSEG